MQVSIIIVNYNTFKLTSSCIESIIKHTKNIDYEIIVVDNASTECNPDLFKEKFPEITLIENKKNTGFAGGNNSGLIYATGSVILLLNSDTYLIENSIFSAYQKMLSSSKIGVLSVKLTYPDGRTQSCCQRFPSAKLELTELLRLQKFLSPQQKSNLFLGAFFDHQSEIEADWVWGTFFMFRKEVLEKMSTKLLPEDFFMYGEDMQWCYEIKKSGYKIIYFPETKVIHHLSASTEKNKNIEKEKLMIKNEYVFLKKYYGNFNAWLVFKFRALKFWTLSWKNNDFKIYVSLYNNPQN